MRSLVATVLVLAALLPMQTARAQSTDDVFSRISPAKMASLLQSKGYRAEIVDGSNMEKVYIATGLNGFAASVQFYDCNTVDCGEIQFLVWFEKDAKKMVQHANAWNTAKRFLKAYVDKDGNLTLTLDTDLKGGVSATYLKQQIALFEEMLGIYQSF